MRLLAVVDLDLRAGRELGAVLQRLPPGERGHPEDVFLDVVVALFEFVADGLGVVRAVRAAVIGGIEEVVALRIAELGLDFLLPGGEGVGDVFEEDQAEHGVLIDSGVEIRAQPVCGGPEFLVEITEELLGAVGHERKSRFSYQPIHAWGRSKRSASPPIFRRHIAEIRPKANGSACICLQFDRSRASRFFVSRVLRAGESTFERKVGAGPSRRESVLCPARRFYVSRGNGSLKLAGVAVW